ncbi:MAG: UDP-N-acetylmuramoyl-L-alanyl-D-glutamate--2,6-diaminopimelate ligase, partial [Clostridiales bacterium]|nr:UDP-N-acetylmuramoyl-L-alanyl-D-glutamate--2,6-diaminopimelate ligase [Clostridiales bacterium]
MKLRGLIKNLDYVLEGSADTEIESIQINTKSGGIKNSLFICIKGLKHDTHMDIAEIIGKGALAIACSKDFDTSRYNFNFIKVDNTRYAMSVAAANFYGNTHENMKLIGVTGTNGKTSIVHLINNILFFNNKGTGSVGTLGNLIGNKALDIKYATSTTPDPIELHHIFSEMYKNNASYVVMEATSHALELCKLDNLKFELAVFTNLTQDHLDFHGSFENYLNAKLKLFDISRLAIINIDDGYSGRVINYCKNRVITYGVNNDCDYRAENISYSSNGVSYSIRAKGKVIGHFYIPIPGTFSVYNSLAAIIACLELGLGIGQIENAFLQMPGIPGRMQAVENDLGVRVIVDYSHTPDGLINVLKSAAGFTEGRVITVAGCGGDRDMGKRPIMGKA